MRISAFARSAALIGEVKSKPSTANRVKKELVRGRNKEEGDSSWWVPHPRTGIYYPKGHEWVMEDIPQGASSFPENYWLRSSEGVENNSDHSTCANFEHPFLDI